MNRKSNFAFVILSILIGLTLILTAVNPITASASAPARWTPTPTATQVITATPITTVTPPSTDPALVLTSDPTYIAPGGQVTISYQILNFENIKGQAALRFYAPDGLALADTSMGKYDEINGTYDIEVNEAEGKILFQADETIAPPVIVAAELLQDGEAIAKAEVTLDELTEFTIEPTGGDATGMGGRVQVTFPGGAVSETVRVKVARPSEVSLPVQSLSGAPFELTAVSDSTRAEVTRFSAPVEIVVSYSDAGLTDDSSTMLYWYDPSDKQWKLPLSQRLDADNNLIYATTDHFTVFDTYTSNWESAQTPTMDYFQTSNFTGAASFSLPIVVPPGPGGLQPSLSLSYSSSVVDNMSSKSQASWAGMGWAIGESYIEHNTNGTQGAALPGGIPRSVDDTYQLTLNGTSIRLFRDGNNVYHSEDEQFFKIERDANDNSWTVWDKSGTKYTFGQQTRMYFVDNDGGSCTLDNSPWRWSLSEVENLYGQTMTYSYVNETKTYVGCGTNPTQPTYAYPEAITYANGLYRVYFERLDATETGHRTDLKSIWLNATSYQSFQRSLLEAIKVQYLNGGNWQTIREYKFTYCDTSACSIFPDLVWDQGGRTPTLISVQEFGLGGSDSLPAYTFAYADKMHLTSATNGYGGTITYVYNNQTNYTDAPQAAWHDTEGGNPRKYRFEGSQSTEGWTNLFPISGGVMQIGTATTQNSGINPIQPGSWYKLVVRAKATSMPGTHTFEFGYTYKENGAWVNDIFQAPVTLGQYWATYESQPFFLPVNATDFVPKIKSTKTNQIDWIYLVPLTTVSRVTSRTLSSGSDNYTYTYVYDDPATNTGTGNHPYDAYHTQFWGHRFVTVSDPYGNTTKTEYSQLEPFVGMPLSVTMRDSFGVKLQMNVSAHDSSTLCTVILTDISDKYDPDTYLQPYDPLYCRWTYTTGETQTIYQADGTTEAGSLTTAYQYEGTYGNLVSQSVSGSIPRTLTTHYEYYNNTGGGNYIVGLPSRTWITNGTGTIAETINVFDGNGFLTKTRTLMNPGQYSQATFGYDSWGNVASLTAYSGYSDGTNDPTTGARTATTVYDSTYHTYPISITTPPTDLYPSGLTTTLTYDTRLGVPTSATGPNGVDTKIEAEYDSFGRLVKLIRPGDDSASPTLAIAYSSGAPFTTTLTQKIQSGQFYMATRVYDGLGRPTSATAGGITTLFDYETISEGGHLYRQDKVSTPFASGESYFWASTKYDALGRPLRVTAPDGTTSTISYNGFETTLTDANGNITRTTTDILGLTRFVDAPTGPDITFDYDDLGNLTSASRGGAVTTIQYDLGGRKTSMSDPDMGNWSYEYDALSNLTSQTDARACTTNLQYDNLNRPKQKSYSNCPATATVTYGYDSGAYGKGFRTSMSDGSGSTSWTYDTRGRLASESKVITGSSPFVTEWTYNSADLPVTMRYPDNEIVTFGYDSRALLYSVIGANAYISDTTYDSAGRVETRALGNGLTQTFDYYNWDEKVNNVGQGGRLKTLTTGSLQNLAYVYDAVGNIKQITNSIASETSTYEYDAIYRLTSWTLNGQTETYQYNPTTGNLSSKAGMGLQYNDTNHVHAATNANSNTYGYDSNGNQTSRQIGGNSYTLSYDAENRLVSVTGPSLNAQFTYDGDGRRVKSVVNGETILFVGGHFELNDTTNQITKYYPGGAIRKYTVPQTTTLNYLLGDHLGSTSLVTDSSGNLLMETRYTPWGEVRYTTPNQTLPTRYTFTGQYSYVADDATDLGAAGFGLMFYNARWYDNTTGRFVQADTIVPGGVQGLDRYAYVNNSPIMHTDPSGHCDEAKKDCRDRLQATHDYAKNPNRPKIGPPPVWVLICGYDSDTTTADDICGVGGALGAYDHGSASTLIVDCRGLTKEACAIKAEALINKWLADRPSSRFVFVGHSSGADAAIMVADSMIKNGQQSKILALVLLDPTLTAKINGVDTSLQEMANRVANNIKTFLADTAHDYYTDPVTREILPILVHIDGATEPESNDTYRLDFDPNYAGKLDYSHIDLALSTAISDYIINVFINPLLQ